MSHASRLREVRLSMQAKTILTYYSRVDSAFEGKKDREKQSPEEAKKPGGPVYTTSTGWLGYSAKNMGKLVEDAVAPRFIQLRLNIVGSRETHKRRQCFARRTAEHDKGSVLIHGNQVRLVDVHTIY